MVYHGHHLDVSVALSRGEVEGVCREREEGKRIRGEDKRNLYLAKEGGKCINCNTAVNVSRDLCIQFVCVSKSIYSRCE